MSKIGKALPPVLMAVAMVAAFGVMMLLIVGTSRTAGRLTGPSRSAARSCWQVAPLMATLTLIAEIIGFVVLSLVFLLGILTVVSAIHDFIRSRSLKYDRYWYDETGRWNARLRRREQPAEGNSESLPG
jgi:hypothetical protein